MKTHMNTHMKTHAIMRTTLTLFGVLLFASLCFAQPGTRRGDDGDQRRMGPQDRPHRMDDQARGPQAREDGPRDGRGGPLGDVMRALRNTDVTPEQRTQIREVMAEHRDAAKQWREANADTFEELKTDMQALRDDHEPLRHEMRDLHQAMDKLLRSDESTDAIMPRIADLRTEWFKLRDQMKADAEPIRERWAKLHETAPSMEQLLDDVVAVLTEDQQARIADVIASARERIARMADGPLFDMNRSDMNRPGMHKSDMRGPQGRPGKGSQDKRDMRDRPRW